MSWSILNTFVCNPNLAFCDLQGLSLLLSNFWSLILIQLQIVFFFFFFSPTCPFSASFHSRGFSIKKIIPNGQYHSVPLLQGLLFVAGARPCPRPADRCAWNTSSPPVSPCLGSTEAPRAALCCVPKQNEVLLFRLGKRLLIPVPVHP